MIISQYNKKALRNPWVWGMMAFLMLFLSVNGVLIYFAYSSPPNLVVKDYYDRGQAYAKELKLLKQQKSLGWNTMIMLPAKLKVNQKQAYDVLIQGQNATEINLESVTFHAYRPSDSRKDFSAAMVKKAPGTYTVNASFPLPGVWDLIIVTVHEGEEYLITKRISVSE